MLETVKERLGEAMIPFKKTRIGRDIYDIGRKEGLKKGRRKGRLEGRDVGRQEGRDAGRREGLLESIHDVLEMRFGRVPARILRLLRARDEVEWLREMLRAAVDAANLETFAGRLWED